MKNKINSLETLRGFAALAVAIYHCPSTSFLQIQYGYLGVYFFFALSGFVIALNYFDRITSINHLINFQIKRFFRLYPIHIFVLGVVLGIQILKLIVLKFFNFNAGNEAFEPDYWYTLRDFFNHLFLTQAVIKNSYAFSWNGAAWTISTEFYTYLVFGLLALILRNNKLLFVIILTIYIFFFNYITSFTNLYFNHLFSECLKTFFMGCLIFFIYEKIRFRLNDALFILLFILTIFLFTEYKNELSIDHNVLFCIIILLVSILKEDCLINKFLNFYPLVYFGTISYSFYMIHQSVLYLYIQILKFIFKVNFLNDGGVTTNTGSPYYDTIIIISYLIISAFFASLMYNYIENKFRR
jgi:peptidoglycan/LPS O-acetylase OafA/YrhL